MYVQRGKRKEVLTHELKMEVVGLTDHWESSPRLMSRTATIDATVAQFKTLLLESGDREVAEGRGPST